MFYNILNGCKDAQILTIINIFFLLLQSKQKT